MPQPAPLTPSNRRLATYSYLRPLVAGRRVVELGCGSGAGAAHLLALGAASVVGVDDPATVERARAETRGGGLSFASVETLESAGRFDLVVVPDAEALLRGRGPLSLAACKRLLGPRGRIVCAVSSGDRRGAGNGLGYYDVVEALEGGFPRVRMFGLTPFVAYGLAEFEETPGRLRVEAGLVDEASEEPTHYVAVGGPAEDEIASLGYALVQVPAAGAAGEGAGAVQAPGRAQPATPSDLPADVAALRRRLAEVQGDHDGVLRVSRAQAEEIEELRARLRRGADARAALDEEVTRLRRALTEADESVLNLTKRTTEEMAALAQRITAGLRVGDDGPGRAEASPAAAEELRRRERDLAARESALSDRDERIAALEAERQDLEWRLQKAEADLRRGRPPAVAASPAAAPDRDEGRRREDELRRLGARTTELERALAEAKRSAGRGDGARERELLETLRARDQALEQLQRAGVEHVREVARLRAALDEQATLIGELEDAFEVQTAQLTASELEAGRLRKQAHEAEEQDRARRSRLAELEGTLLRLQRQTQLAAADPRSNGASDGSAVAQAEARIAAATIEARALEARLADSERVRQQAERRLSEATARLAELEGAHASLAADRDGLESRLCAAAPSGDSAALAAAVGEAERLRTALQASEEQLWEVRGQLLIDRERIAVLEHQLADAQTALQAFQFQPPPSSTPVQRTVSEAAHRSILETVFRELSTIENALRLEIVEISALEREIAEWRAAVAASEARVRLSP